MKVKGKALTVAFVRKAPPGKHHDGVNGLFLRVTPSGSRQWVTRLTVNGRRRDFGLGGFPLVALAEARDMAFELRRSVRRGEDPAAALRPGASVPTFAEACERTIELHRPTWRGDRTEGQWRSTMRRYALPVLGGMTVDTIGTGDVLRVVGPIWTDKPTIAQQLRVRIGAVLKWAIGEGHRTDNPAGEAVTAALPKRNGGTRHHRAADHADMAGILATVAGSDANHGTRLTLAFVALTACRSGEARGATWGEIDGQTWTVPADRTKTNRPHRVPLAAQALAILDEARVLARGGVAAEGLVFPSARGKVVSVAVLARPLEGTGSTVHGMRTAFRSWCADTGVDREVAEMALGHVVPGVEGAYQRSDLCERRRDLMQRWADYTMPMR